LVIDPCGAGVGRTDAVLEQAHAFGAGLDTRVVVAFQEGVVTAHLRVDGLSNPKVNVGPAVTEPFGVQRAHAIGRQALLFEVGHAVVQDAVRFTLHLVDQLIGMGIGPLDGGPGTDETIALRTHIAGPTFVLDDIGTHLYYLSEVVLPHMKIEKLLCKRKVIASDVAERAGVSKWTVSRAFTEGASISARARERVLEAAQALGYKPNLRARSLTKRRTQMVGLVIDELANPNLFLVFDEVTRQLQRRGYMSMLLNISAEHSIGTALSLADPFQADALIFLGTVLTDELIEMAQDIRHIPFIVPYRNSDVPNIQVVSTDGYRAGQEIAGLFLEQGYGRVGYMRGPASESTQLKRLDGFRDTMSSRGCQVEAVLEAWHYRRDCGFETMRRYLVTVPEQDRFEAIFCENDILAIGALDALKMRGDEDSIAMIGFDDIDQAGSPLYDLTTYRQPLETLVS